MTTHVATYSRGARPAPSLWMCLAVLIALLLNSVPNQGYALPYNIDDAWATVNPQSVTIHWQTVHEIGVIGYHIYRNTTPTRPATPLTVGIVLSQAPGSSMGFYYEWQDTSVVRCRTYYYWVEAIAPDGSSSQIVGPFTATMGCGVILTSVRAEVSGASPILFWQVSTEWDVAGYHVYRASTPSLDGATRLNRLLLPSTSNRYEDRWACGTVYYWVEVIARDGLRLALSSPQRLDAMLCDKAA